MLARKVSRHAVVHLEKTSEVSWMTNPSSVGISAPIHHHIQHRAKFAGLPQSPGGLPIDRIEQTADPVDDEAQTGVVGHDVE